MTRGLLRGACGLALSLLALWSAQAQTTEALPNPLAAPPGSLFTTPSSAQSPQSQQPNAAVAPVPDGLPEAIARQRQALAAQRSVIEQAEKAQQTVCWQKFAVNACLTEARRARRQALEPLRQQELALNAQERSWRTEQRELRLQGKQNDTRETP